MYNAFSNPDGLGQWSGVAWQNSVDIGDLIPIMVIFLGMNKWRAGEVWAAA